MLRVDPTSNALIVDYPSSGANVPLQHSSITEGSKTVAIAGTPETLVAVSTTCKMVIVQAYLSNAGNIAFGGSNTVDASTTGDGTLLEPGDSWPIFIDDAQKVWMDVLNNGDGARFNIFD